MASPSRNNLYIQKRKELKNLTKKIYVADLPLRVLLWYQRVDLNHRSFGYEPNAFAD